MTDRNKMRLRAYQQVLVVIYLVYIGKAYTRASTNDIPEGKIPKHEVVASQISYCLSPGFAGKPISLLSGEEAFRALRHLSIENAELLGRGVRLCYFVFEGDL